MTEYRDKIFAAIASLAITAAIFLSQGMLVERAPHPGALERYVQQLDTGTDGTLTGAEAPRTGQS